MPRLVIVVDKDCEGKIWNYVFSEKMSKKQLLRNTSVGIRKHYLLKRWPECEELEVVSGT